MVRLQFPDNFYRIITIRPDIRLVRESGTSLIYVYLRPMTRVSYILKVVIMAVPMLSHMDLNHVPLCCLLASCQINLF
jgi:hypothetical protein